MKCDVAAQARHGDFPAHSFAPEIHIDTALAVSNDVAGEAVVAHGVAVVSGFTQCRDVAFGSKVALIVDFLNTLAGVYPCSVERMILV